MDCGKSATQHSIVLGDGLGSSSYGRMRGGRRILPWPTIWVVVIPNLTRYASDARVASARRREMADYLVVIRLVRKGNGERYGSDSDKALDMIDRMTVAELTLLELEMQGRQRAGHESEYDPLWK